MTFQFIWHSNTTSLLHWHCMSSSSLYKFLIYFFLLYPLFGIFALRVLGNAPGNITGLMMLLLILIVLINLNSFKPSRYLLFYFLFWLYTTILNSVKLDTEIGTFKYLYSNNYLHFLIFLLLLQIDIKKMRLNLKLIHRILVILIIFSAVVIIIQQFIPIFFIM